VHRRFLAVLAVAAFVLTLLFAVAAGAQEESTSTEGVGAQAVEVQQQQVPEDQQQGLIFAEGQQSGGVQVAAESGALRGEEVETRSTDNDPRIEVMRIPFPNDCKMTKNKVSFVLEDEDGTQADFIEGNNVKITKDGDELKLTRDPSFGGPGGPNDIVPLNPRGGDRQLDTGGLTVATSTGITCDNDSGGGGPNDLDCADFSSQSAAQNKLEEDRSDPHNLDADNNGRACEDFNYGGGGGGGGGDGNNPVSVAQENSVPETTTSNLNTANPNTTAADANLNAAANRPDSGSFRCEFFLRTVTDDQGALRDQYRGNEQIVQRFEQCLSENVLADTIPNRALPFTGGMSLLFLGAIGLAAIVAGAAVLRAVMRRVS
jgi:hypothetical protein